MRRHFPLAGVLMLAPMPALAPFAVPAAGQEPDADAFVDLQQAIYLYLGGQPDRPEVNRYERAIELLSSVLERDPDNAAALLYRALCYGQLGLALRDQRLGHERVIEENLAVIRSRDDPQVLAEIEARIAEWTARLDDEALPLRERVILEHELGRESDFKDAIADAEGMLLDELKADIDARRTLVRQAESDERARYELMLDSLERLIRALREPDSVLQLLEVIARSKIARLDEDAALRLLADSNVVDGQPPRPTPEVQALRKGAEATLDRAAELLETLLKEDLSAQDRIRAGFFLGVLRYRQAVPRRDPNERVRIDHNHLAAAEALMRALADDPQAPQEWRSYAALYLGLIVPFRAARDAGDARRAAVFDEAVRRLDQAGDLDTRMRGDPPQAESVSRAIPTVIARQRQHIASMREQPPAAPEYRNDVLLSVNLGPSYDTNVVLLGERTDLPRGIRDKDDFGFTLATAIGYTLDLGKLDSSLDRWALGLQGRVSALWHEDIGDFDEQQYGASVALQYEAVPAQEEFGPVYLKLQYDYAYTLLGRDGFVSTNAVRPSVQVHFMNRRSVTDVYFIYELRDYFEPVFDRRFERSGEYPAIGLAQRFRTVDLAPIYEDAGLTVWGHPGDDGLAQEDPDYPARFLELFGAFEYSWDATAGSEFDLKGYTLAGGVAVPLPWGWLLDAGAQFEWEEYQDGSLVDFHRRPRRDFIQQYAVGLSRTYVLRDGVLYNRYAPAIDRVLMTVRAHATWTLDDANVVDRLGQSVFEYDRAFYGISIGFSFN
ncbi:MAG: hypothetical protein C4547_13915 [Phycisphaerales bacterium]|nr:MAG: hypothetical protein C4547_13915 [Phycisphaerales bacterium]